MAHCRPPKPAKLIVAMLSAYPGALAAAESELLELYGPVDVKSDMLVHEFTTYYRDEMGYPLIRYMIAFERLIDPADLRIIKQRTNEIEVRLARGGEWPDVARPINLDPGYITPAKFVLASCKDYTHRIYLGDGIYAETTLGYTAGAWKAYEWSYPDYRSAEHQQFLTRTREALMSYLRRPK